MMRALLVLAILTAGVAAWFALPLAVLSGAIQPVLVALSIVLAGILVRLNRGMPTLDWKILQPNEKKNLAAAVQVLAKEYLYIFALNAVLGALFLAIAIVGHSQIANLPAIVQSAVASIIGALATLCAVRVSYVVWRDYDIVRLQKTLIFAAADREEADAQKAEADRKLAEMKSTSLRAQ